MADGQTAFTEGIGERLLPVEIDYRNHQHVHSVILTQAAPVFGKLCEDLPALADALGQRAPFAIGP